MAVNATANQVHAMATLDQYWAMLSSDVFIFGVGIIFNVALLFSHRLVGWLFPKTLRKKETTSKQMTAKAPAMSRKHMESMQQTAELRKRHSEEDKSGVFEALRSLRKGSHYSDVSRVLAHAMEQTDGSDESLMSVFVDACIRINRVDMLGHWMRKCTPAFAKMKKEHTFCSIIRGYGAIGDITGVWVTWKELRKSHRCLVCVTVGCMVGALVAHGDPEAAHDLVKELQLEEDNQNTINSVVYGTVIKGFAHQKKFNRAWLVYQEMKAVQSAFTIVTFNTLIDACARCEQPHRIPGLLEDMAGLGIQRDIITYGAALKGYCQEGSIDKAVELLQEMRDKTEFKLDEMMYNSLLDGCAKTGLWSRANAVVNEMVESGVRPSTFTLSVLVKVGRRSCSPIETVFEVVDALSREHCIKFNAHVYTNLIHLCVSRKDWNKALTIFEKMIEDGLRPDARTYTVLLKGLVSNGNLQTADGVFRAALGMPGANASLFASANNNDSRLRSDAPLPKDLLAEIVDGMVSRGEHGKVIACQLLSDMKDMRLAIDPKVKLRFAAHLTKVDKC